MLIVLEGCDGSGKTTLAKFLAPILNAEIVHCTTETPNRSSWFCDIIEAAENKNIIADRFCYGQFVYQKEQDRQLTKEDLYYLEVIMLKIKTKVIFVDASTKAIEHRLEARDEKTLLSVEEIQHKYKELFSKSLIDVLEVKTDEIPLRIGKFSNIQACERNYAEFKSSLGRLFDTLTSLAEDKEEDDDEND